MTMPILIISSLLISKNLAKRYDDLYGVDEFTEDDEPKFSTNTNEATHLLPVVEVLDKYNFQYEIKPDVSKQHDDIYLQDQYMNKFFKYYPEFICVDLLCEIVNLELNLYLILSADSNGHCEIIAAGLFKSCESGLEWFCDVFKKHNLNWRKIRVIMSDKKARNNEILKGLFPEKLVFISFFHSMKALKKDLLNLDCKMTDEDINKVVKIFEQMIFSYDESNYSELLKQLKSMPPAVSTYFRKTWHQKKDSWVLNNQLYSKIFLKSFNFYLNVMRKVIRPVISTLNSVESVIKSLCFSIEKMRLKRFKNFTAIFSQPSAHQQAITYKYLKVLTAYAVELVSEQINFSLEVKNLKKLGSGKYICSSEDIVTINTCSCSFFQLLLLPCSHIFSLRRLLSLPLYVESICSIRWISSTYQRTYCDLQNIFSINFEKTYPEKPLHFDSFQRCFKISADLWPLLVLCPENVSRDHILMFQTILRAWKNGLKVSIKTDVQKETTNNSIIDSSNDNWKELYGISLKDILDSDNDFSVLPLNL
ncbi:zinc finger SWIM domain-containing protein 3 isoform X2 [Parasteatoda tepidariorum]|uniref:zinc finger SWIM domain-containing protein 3 isoform X2 n=1 Tax=Parasteatoda tepidariorum TaxID=114398 RepID=UPI001C720259|nr:uncharacterized protein LOC107456900 isoform X2 [Parasteatoda tepidariorum]